MSLSCDEYVVINTQKPLTGLQWIKIMAWQQVTVFYDLLFDL